MFSCNYQFLSFFCNLLNKPFKGYIQGRLGIVVFQEFKVVFKLLSFVANPVVWRRSHILKFYFPTNIFQEFDKRETEFNEF